MPKKADTLFTNAIELKMDEEFNQYEPGAVAVKGDSILAASPEDEIKKVYSA